MEFPQHKVPESFQNIFYHLIQNEEININDGIINLFCMKIHNKSFDTSSLVDELSDSIVSYCLSQTDYDEFYQKHNIGKMYRQAASLFRDYASNKGELGEIILYSFLESHLNAPKIISKMKLKTSTNDYVKRADGIHMLKLDDENYELILGESKMYESLNDGIKDAFNSIHELKTRTTNNIDDEINLISTNISSEFAKENYELIKKIIKPSKNEDYEYDVSFGVFVGFEMKIKKILDSNPSQIDFKKQIKEKAQQDVLNKIDTIRQQIINLKLGDHNFYIYFIPFFDIDKTRKDIIKQLTQ
ncbi:HamA C-terminal domain-containing protein [Clostridium botulinum]|uniref:Anti-bacteriophage protein A/HamA C-terminal domain-containing protein n=1 Tax=Clostridium botulinum (strain Kyoto / Type A2) TaxID=536232 RepID=C1FPY2_CLOBJ|nr:DUF1837 domain-containing protein [Clostridium botulinum]ACO84210.1 conserved hypothetical protein [Clostridium botulinum A2 str. Kyoto]AUN07225.1 hypothetical protein RSJ14_11145 [Clostridium botulinum]MBN3364510.1 hypothetical protein [Clostridium botulinum]MBN3376082.1 hypothetical protein [Clostridium botulinum]MBN3385266.1 hypothetical protein [Clostridium botulinum]